MTTVIQLYGKSFSIGFSDTDDSRRKKFFKEGSGNLTPQEKALLISIGVDAMLETSLKPYLAQFFSTLQTCSGDASLVLSRNCDIAYFVLWSALFHNHAEVERRVKGTKRAVIDDLDLAQDQAIISGLKPRVRPQPAAAAAAKSGNEEKDIFKALFTLMVLGQDGAPAGNATINELFTLMVFDAPGHNNAGNNADNDDAASSASIAGSAAATGSVSVSAEGRL
jgi:hypothetical protein